jgi:hypothetical protein
LIILKPSLTPSRQPPTRAQWLAAEAHAAAEVARQQLVDEQRRLLKAQAVDADKQKHIESALIGNLTAVLCNLEQLATIEQRFRPRWQRNRELNRELQRLHRDPGQATRTPGWLMVSIRTALQELRRR